VPNVGESDAAVGLAELAPLRDSLRRRTKTFPQFNGVAGTQRAAAVVGRRPDGWPLVLTSRGKDFQAANIPPTDQGGGLQAVGALTPGQYVAVGYEYTSPPVALRGIVLRNRGTEWSIERPLGDLTSILQCVTVVADSVWIGGHFVNRHGDSPHLLPWSARLNDQEWTVCSPKLGPDWSVTDIDGRSGDFVVSSLASRSFRGALVRWDGKQYARLVSDCPALTKVVVVDAESTWAVDYLGQLWHLTGSRFDTVDRPKEKEPSGSLPIQSVAWVDGELLCLGTDWLGSSAGLRVYRSRTGRWLSEHLASGRGKANPAVSRSGEWVCACGGLEGTQVLAKSAVWSRRGNKWVRLSTPYD
jgi:hypothetical protein